MLKFPPLLCPTSPGYSADLHSFLNDVANERAQNNRVIFTEAEEVTLAARDGDTTDGALSINRQDALPESALHDMSKQVLHHPNRVDFAALSSATADDEDEGQDAILEAR